MCVREPFPNKRGAKRGMGWGICVLHAILRLALVDPLAALKERFHSLVLRASAIKGQQTTQQQKTTTVFKRQSRQQVQPRAHTPKSNSIGSEFAPLKGQ